MTSDDKQHKKKKRNFTNKSDIGGVFKIIQQLPGPPIFYKAICSDHTQSFIAVLQLTPNKREQKDVQQCVNSGKLEAC